MPLNTYVTLDSLKGSGALSISTSTAADGRMLAVLEDISRQVDRQCMRHFYFLEEVRTFNGSGVTELAVDDLIAIPGSGLKEDTNADGTFETVWASADFLLWPYNAAPTSAWGMSYSRIIVNLNSNGTQDHFIRGTQNYQITGTWGYRRELKATGFTGSMATIGTTQLIAPSGSGTLEVGHTIVIGTEQVYITSVVTAGSVWNVMRAVNGATTGSGTNLAISLVLYPGPVVEAVMIQASRLWRRRDSGFASQVGMPETGQMMVWRGGLDPDARELLNGYRKMVV